MAIYEITSDKIKKIEETSFRGAGVKERNDLQRLLREQIEIISPDTLVIAEEFGEWEGSKRRIDLLGLDKKANLVVIELKRTEDGGYMELQAIRYAAMVSTMTFDKAVEVYGQYLKKMEKEVGARETILEFLGWDESEIDEDQFAQDVRIVLASAEFSKELSTAVMWLNEREIEIRCIRLKPYAYDERLLLDVQQIIPLPEAEQYQVQISEKNRKERIARTSRDYTKFDVSINGQMESQLGKNKAIFRVVFHLCQSGISPQDIEAIIFWRRLFEVADGDLNSQEFVEVIETEKVKKGGSFDSKRYFCNQTDLIVFDGKTYAFSNQWGTRTKEAINLLLNKFPDKEITCTVSGSQFKLIR